MKVLILSSVFPTWHPRAGKPTGFRDKFEAGEKIHTIRANAKKYFKDGDVVSIREWSGRPYGSGSKQVVIMDGVRIGVEPVVLHRIDIDAAVARNDGLSMMDFRWWFFSHHSAPMEFAGDILHFTDFRYGEGESWMHKSNAENAASVAATTD